VAIARAIAKRPDVLLCDEPTGALDSKTGITVLEALSAVNEELGTATAIITHNAEIRRIAHRVVFIADGRHRADRDERDAARARRRRLVMRALDRKLVRDLRAIWAQGLAIALVLACGIAVLVLATGAERTLSSTRDAYYERNRFADVFAGATRAPEALLEEIGRIDGVAQVEGRIASYVLLDMPGMIEPAMGRLVSLPEAGEPRLNVPLLRSGRLPDPLRPDEVAVAEPFAEAHGMRPGDSFAAILNGQRRVLTITGLLLSPEFIYTMGPGTLIPDDRRFGILWMGHAAAAAAFDMDGAFNDVALALTRTASEPAVIARLDDLLEPFGGTGAHGRDGQISHAFLQSELDQLGALSVVLPPVFLVVSAFLVNMVLGRLIALERRQIGLMKAIGYPTPAIAFHYLKMSAGIGIGGVLIGWGFGAWGAERLAALYADFFRFPYLVYVPNPAAFAVAGALGVAAVVLGALRAVHASVGSTRRWRCRRRCRRATARASSTGSAARSRCARRR
jgi:putative ABC transport system permease protein